jgi:predicted nucleotidyltransferase
MTRIDQIKEEIVKRIKNNLKIKEIIFLGSFASGIPNKDSDLDMVVVLDERGFSKNYEERLGKRQRVTELISDLRYQIPIDVLVFTEDE